MNNLFLNLLTKNIFLGLVLLSNATSWAMELEKDPLYLSVDNQTPYDFVVEQVGVEQVGVEQVGVEQVGVEQVGEQRNYLDLGKVLSGNSANFLTLPWSTESEERYNSAYFTFTNTANKDKNKINKIWVTLSQKPHDTVCQKPYDTVYPVFFIDLFRNSARMDSTSSPRTVKKIQSHLTRPKPVIGSGLIYKNQNLISARFNDVVAAPQNISKISEFNETIYKITVTLKGDESDSYSGSSIELKPYTPEMFQEERDYLIRKRQAIEQERRSQKPQTVEQLMQMKRK